MKVESFSEKMSSIQYISMQHKMKARSKNTQVQTQRCFSFKANVKSDKTQLFYKSQKVGSISFILVAEYGLIGDRHYKIFTGSLSPLDCQCH